MVNSTNYHGKNKPYVTSIVADQFNIHIEELQKVIDKDLSHWRILI